jgi:hypothetical protein
VAAAVRDYCVASGVGAAILPPATPDFRCDALVCVADGRFTRVVFPPYFNAHDFALAASLSASLQTLVSAIHVYDGDYWAHAAWDRGTLVDRFASMPDYFEPDDRGAQRARWRGDATTLAQAFEVEPEALAPYFVHLELSSEQLPIGKAFAEDEFDRDETWVHVDFWRRLGIHYPEPFETELLVRLDEDFLGRLPTGDENDL